MSGSPAEFGGSRGVGRRAAVAFGGERLLR
jgi:hypothetical protein